MSAKDGTDELIQSLESLSIQQVVPYSNSTKTHTKHITNICKHIEYIQEQKRIFETNKIRQFINTTEDAEILLKPLLQDKSNFEKVI